MSDEIDKKKMNEILESLKRNGDIFEFSFAVDGSRNVIIRKKEEDKKVVKMSYEYYRDHSTEEIIIAISQANPGQMIKN